MKIDLNKLIEIFNKLEARIRYAIFGAMVLLAVLLDVFVIMLPQIGGISSDSAEIKHLSDDTKQVLIDRQRMAQLKKNLEEDRQQLKAMENKVRPIQEVPVILSTISSIANDYGVKIDQLLPDKSKQEPLTSTKDAKYYALPVMIKARGGYHMLGHFLNKLESGDLAFIMKDFIIQEDANNGKLLLFSMTIKIILVDKH